MGQFRGALFIVAVGSAVWAQNPLPTDRPEIRQSKPAPAEQTARQAQTYFAQAVVEYRHDRLLDAIRLLEKCLVLDPDATPPRKLLAISFAAVGRSSDALAEWKKVTAAANDDYDAWERYANLLHESGATQPARAALRQAVASKALQHHPETWLLLLNRLATWSEKGSDGETAELALRELARVLVEKQEALRAAGVLTHAEIVQERADALERLGEACLRNRKLADAEAAFTESGKLLSARADSHDAARIGRLHWHQAQVLAARNEPARALDQLRLALRQRPGSVEPYRLFVKLLQQLDRPRELAAEFEVLARADRKNVQLQLLLAEQYADAGRLAELQPLFAALLEAGPKVELYRDWFRHYQKNNRFDLVLRTLDERLAVASDKNKPEEERDQANAHARTMFAVLRNNPALIRALLPLAWDQRWREFREKRNLDYRTYEALGRLAARAGDLPAAERLLRDSLQGLRGRRWGGWDATIIESLIQVLMAQKKYRDVVTLCQERIQEGDDNLFMFYYYQAWPLARLGNVADALRVNQTAIEIGADNGKFLARLQRVEVLRWAGRLDDAVKECTAVLKEYPRKKETRDTLRSLAAVYSTKGDHGRAELELRKLLDHDPNDAGVCNDLGYQLAEQSRNLDEAQRLIRRALDLDRLEKHRGGSGDDDSDDLDDNPAYLDSWAWVLFRKGNAVEARRILEKAVTHPDARDDVTMWDHLGDICYRLGDAAAARTAWTRAYENTQDERRVRKDGRFDEIKRKLQVLPNK